MCIWYNYSYRLYSHVMLYPFSWYIYIIIVTITSLDLKVHLVAPNNYELYTYLPVCKRIYLGPGWGDVHCFDVEVYSTIDIIVVYSHVP